MSGKEKATDHFLIRSVFHMQGQPYGPGNSFAVLLNPITFYQQSFYTISFAARQTFVSRQTCVLEIGWKDSNYVIRSGTQFSETWTLYGPTTFETVGGFSPPDNTDGSYNADLSVLVSCYGIQGQVPPAEVLFEIDTIVIKPA